MRKRQAIENGKHKSCVTCPLNAKCRLLWKILRNHAAI